GHAQATAFEGNVYYVELAGVRAAQDVLPAILTTLEIPLPPDGGEPEKLLVAHLRRQHALLVLDNFEQVLDAAPAVARIAAACPRAASPRRQPPRSSPTPASTRWTA